MNGKRSDEELVAQMRSGATACFEELVSRYTPKVFSLASRLLKNREDAEEVLQDVFHTVYRKIDGFEGKSSFSSWLYRITVNSAFMKLRKRRQQHRFVGMDDVPVDVQKAVTSRSVEAGGGDATALSRQLHIALEQAVERLPEEYRPVFILRDVDGLSSHEVSEILDITVPAVKSRLHRSRLMLRRRLMRYYRELEGQAAPESVRAAG